MDRRKFLKGLLALPLAPIIAKLAPVGIPVKYTDQLKVTDAWVDGPMTASEIRARQEERMLDLKPVLERIMAQERSWNTKWRDLSAHILPGKVF